MADTNCSQLIAVALTANMTTKDWDVRLIFSLLHFHCMSGNNGCFNSWSHGDNSSEIVTWKYIGSDFIYADNRESTKWRRSRAVWWRQVKNFDWHFKPIGPQWSAAESTERGKAVWWQSSGWPKALLSSAYNKTCCKGNSLMPAWLIVQTYQLALSYCSKSDTKVTAYKISLTRDTEASSCLPSLPATLLLLHKCSVSWSYRKSGCVICFYEKYTYESWYKYPEHTKGADRHANLPSVCVGWQILLKLWTCSTLYLSIICCYIYLYVIFCNSQ